MAAAAAARPARTQDPLVALRNLIIKDQVALREWTGVVDDIVTEPVHVLCIKSMLDDGKYAEAVLQSLQVWHSKDGQHVDLLDVLKQHQLIALIAAIMGSECRILFKETRSGSTRSRISFEVRKLIGNFTGREEELEILHKLLTELHSRDSFDRNVVSISGLGGIGKSTLARKYALTYKDFYDGNIIWVDAQSLDSMRASFIRLSTRLGLQGGDKLSNEELAARVFEYFEDNKCLFIFDNIEYLDHFKQFEPAVENSDHEAPHVLLTSREIGLTSLPNNEMHLDVLKIEEAVKLIRVYLPKSTDENVVKLAEGLQRLPLALQQALAYIRFVYIKNSAEDGLIVKYLKDFEESKDLLNDKTFKKHNGYAETTFATWKTTLTRIKEISGGESATKIINALAYLNPNSISVNFVSAIVEDEAEARRGLKLLDRFSMVRVNDGKVAIHRLVQHVVRLSFCEREEEVLQKLAEGIWREFNKEGNKLSDAKRECTSHGLHLFPFQMSHKNSEAVTANCGYFNDLCHFLNQYGNYDEALSVSQQMAALYESVKGEDHESTIRMKWKMADAYSFMDKYSDSLPILNSILPVAKSTLGSEHRVTMVIQSTLADDLSLTGDSVKALRIYNEMIPVAERVYGESENVLIRKSNKARALSILRKYDQALELLQHVLEKRITLYGENDVRTLRTKSQIAFVHFDKREYSKALRIWEEVEVGYGNALGDTHPATVAVRKNISICKEELARRERSNCQML